MFARWFYSSAGGGGRGGGGGNDDFMNGLLTGRGLKDVREELNLGIFWLLMGGMENDRGRVIMV